MTEQDTGTDPTRHPGGVPFGRYTLLRKIATGGMAQLYLASMRGEADFKKFCVVKKILPHLSEQPHFVEMFLDEARIAAQLNHPNIVQIYDLGRVGSAYFIAMEYISGEDLAQLFSRSRKARQELPVELCARIAADICAGLHFAHEQIGDDGQPLNIVHRDVSPQNVLMTYDGQVKLVDFGIAKAANKVAHTRTGTIMGKAAYMAPEQCMGEPIDRRSDVFAVGVLLFELLTLSRLFKRDNELLTMRTITDEDAPPVSSRRSTVPEVLGEIVARALQRDRQMRYPSCLEMREALELFIADFGVPASSLELGTLLEERFPDHVDRKLRMKEAGSLSEVIRALPDTGIQDLGTPSAQSQHTLTDTAAPPLRTGLWAGLVVAVLGLIAALALILVLRQSAASQGQLVLTSTPSGAAVRLDGTLRGATPLTLDNLELQQAYLLEVAASGFHPHRVNLYLTAEHPAQQQHLALDALPPATLASLKVVTDPSGASIFVDNVDTGLKSPAQLDQVAAGIEHRIQLRLEGYRHESRAVLLRAGDSQNLELALRKLPRKPLRPVVRPVDRQPRARVDAGAAIRPSPAVRGKGLLTLRTRPWTRVFHGQVELGETPLFKVELPAGPVTLRLVNSEKGIDRKITVKIQPDQVTTVDRKL